MASENTFLIICFNTSTFKLEETSIKPEYIVKVVRIVLDTVPENKSDS